VTEEQLRELSRYEESGAFSAAEKLVLDLAVAMTATPPQVSDDLFGSLKRHFSSAQLVKLVSAVSQANFRGRFNRAFHCRSAGDSGSGSCPLPERS
jgi:alkylhydroperoxidase family enzyme